MIAGAIHIMIGAGVTTGAGATDGDLVLMYLSDGAGEAAGTILGMTHIGDGMAGDLAGVTAGEQAGAMAGAVAGEA